MTLHDARGLMAGVTSQHLLEVAVMLPFPFH